MNSLRDLIGQPPLALRGLCLAALILLAASGASRAEIRQVEGSLSSGARLFRDHCQRCHNPELRNSGLDLSSREAALVGGKQGPALHLDQPEESPVFRKTSSGEMPFDVRLPETEKQQLLEWLASAAPWPQYAANGPALPDDEVHRTVREGKTTSSQVTEGKDEQHWAFARTEKPRVPGVEAGNTHPIDAFLLSQQEELGLTPVGEADRQTLVRGAFFNLIGLPPSPEEAEQFVVNSSPESWENLLDGLLASPHFGERWGRHWLDVARFSESEGYEFDRFQRWAYQYRDFVIGAFNDNMPYDQFLEWQIAGDELAPRERKALSATGFMAVGPNQTNLPTELEKYDALDDMLGTTTQAMLGITLACARCHDHKYDPISQRDYYQMLAFLRPSQRLNHHLTQLAEPELVRTFESRKAQFKKWLRPRQEQLLRSRLTREGVSSSDRETLISYAVGKTGDPDPQLLGVLNRLKLASDDEIRTALLQHLEAEEAVLLDQYEKEVSDLEARIEFAFGIGDEDHQVPETHVLRGGQPANQAERVEPLFLPVLTDPSTDSKRWFKQQPSRETGTTYLRSALARWIVDPEAGAGLLAARVMVNRIWAPLMNAPLVQSVDNFGRAGLAPTYPRLLEWLAHEFIQTGWDLKRMIKLVMTSQTYRLSSRQDPARVKLDAVNRYYWKRLPKRLEAEVIRDAILSVSGKLNLQTYGPSVRPRIHPDALATATNLDVASWPADIVGNPDTWRRSVYIRSRRSMIMPFVETFDGPNSTISIGQRQTTTLPTQSLYLLNSEFVREHAGYFAQRVRERVGENPSAQINQIYRLSLAREATLEEIELAGRFLRDQAESYSGTGKPQARSPEEAGRLALTDLCQAVLALDEFVYVD